MAQHDQHFVSQIAGLVHAQLQDDAKRMGPALIGDRQPDAHRVPQDAFANFVRHAWWHGVPEQHWSADQYRANLLQRIGPKQMVAAYHHYIEPDVKRAEAALQHMSMQIPPMGMAPPPMAPTAMDAPMLGQPARPWMPNQPPQFSPGGPPPGMGMSPSMPMPPMGGGPPSRPMLMPPRPGGM